MHQAGIKNEENTLHRLQQQIIIEIITKKRFYQQKSTTTNSNQSTSNNSFLNPNVRNKTIAHKLNSVVVNELKRVNSISNMSNYHDNKQQILANNTTVSTNSVTSSPILDERVRFLIEFTAGAVGGAVSRTATAPIDRLRTIYQVQSVDVNKKDLNLLKLWKYMIMEGNWAGLWRGNFVNVIKTAPENAIRLATYEKLKKLLNKNTNKNYNTFSEKLVCGSAAGFIATLILYPLKTVKTIMNLGNTGEFRSIADCINKLYVAHGLRAFYRGLLANSIAIIPSAGIDLATYETLKHTYSRYKNKNEPNVIEKLIMGNFSSCMGNFVVYPLFFARTRLQSNRNPNETTLNLLIHVWRRDGLIGWYRGFLLHILKIGPAASISYVIFESVTKTFSLESLK